MGSSQPALQRLSQTPIAMPTGSAAHSRSSISARLIEVAAFAAMLSRSSRLARVGNAQRRRFAPMRETCRPPRRETFGCRRAERSSKSLAGHPLRKRSATSGWSAIGTPRFGEHRVQRADRWRAGSFGCRQTPRHVDRAHARGRARRATRVRSDVRRQISATRFATRPPRSWCRSSFGRSNRTPSR